MAPPAHGATEDGTQPLPAVRRVYHMNKTCQGAENAAGACCVGWQKWARLSYADSDSLTMTDRPGPHDSHITTIPARSSAPADVCREDAPGQPGAPRRPDGGRPRARGEPRYRLPLARALRGGRHRGPAPPPPRQAPAEDG